MFAEFQFSTNLQTLVDLAAQLGLREVLGEEDRLGGAAEFLERLVGRVLRPATRKAPQHLLRFGGPQACFRNRGVNPSCEMSTSRTSLGSRRANTSAC